MAKFEWDKNKNKSNDHKHKIRFEKAVEVFEDPKKVTLRSDRKDEERFQTLGKIAEKIFGVAWCNRPPRKRIISARPANKKEQKKYNSINK